MRTVRRIALAILMALIFVAGVSAQEEKTSTLVSEKAPSSRPRYINPPKEDPCKVKVRVHAYAPQRSKELFEDYLSPEQTKWWLNNRKKFPGICLTTEKGLADYVVVWSAAEETTTHSYTIPKTETTYHRGTINTTSNTTGTLGSTDTYGTYSGTSTKTTYEKNEYEWTVVYVNAYVHEVISIGGGEKKLLESPSFTAQHKGQWRWSKPDKDALKKSLEYIWKQEKKKLELK